MKRDKVKAYLKNKKLIKQDLSMRISALKEDINSSKADFYFDISDFSLSTTSLVIPTKEGMHRDVSDAVLRYEKAVDRLIKQHHYSIQCKTEILEKLSAEKAFYDSVDRMIYTLDEREYIAVTDLINGEKVHHTAEHLNCSYNTARAVLARAIDNISRGIDDGAEEVFRNWQ